MQGTFCGLLSALSWLKVNLQKPRHSPNKGHDVGCRLAEVRSFLLGLAWASDFRNRSISLAISGAPGPCCTPSRSGWAPSRSPATAPRRRYTKALRGGRSNPIVPRVPDPYSCFMESYPFILASAKQSNLFTRQRAQFQISRPGKVVEVEKSFVPEVQLVEGFLGFSSLYTSFAMSVQDTSKSANPCSTTTWNLYKPACCVLSRLWVRSSVCWLSTAV